jgi:hypothetical protein
MAILEIARIQVRRGQETVTGLPQLDSGEFGWSIDTQKLYIGNGGLAEGAPDVGNTRILTERDNVFNLSTATYQYAGGYRTPGIVTLSRKRSLQHKLDDFVTVYDFGETVSTITLQAAINDLFLNSSDKTFPASRPALRLPAGSYSFTDTVFLPPYTTIIGEGQDKTVLTISNSSKPLFQFMDQTSSVYQDGQTNIQSATHPTNITLIGLTFKYSSSVAKTNAVPLLRVDCATDSYISDCKFAGSYVYGNSSDTGYTGIDIRGQGAITTKDLIIDNCTFDGLFYGIKSNYDIEDVVISNSRFRNLRRGIVYKEFSIIGNSIGPLRSKINKNKFINIEREGIYVGTSTVPTQHTSSYNTFKEVGNNIAGDLNAVYPIINFLSQGNNSVGDQFARFNSINLDPTNNLFPPLVSGYNYTEQNSVYNVSVIASNTRTVLSKFPYSGEQSYKVQYSVVKPPSGVSRKGDLLINVSQIGDNTTATITDSYSYSGSTDGGVVFTVEVNTETTTLVLGYTSPDSYGTISYKFSQFQ